MTDPLTRCRLVERGLTTCREYDVRAVARDRARSVGLSTNGFDPWFENHGKTVTVTDRNEADR